MPQLPSQDRELVVYLNLLKLQGKIDKQMETFGEFRTEVLQLKKYVSGNWAPSKIQQVRFVIHLVAVNATYYQVHS